MPLWTQEEVSSSLDQIRKNKKVVFTNGCFDILHVGHLRYLQDARALGDFLIVGLNSDASVKRFKGSQRPIQNEKDRAEIHTKIRAAENLNRNPGQNSRRNSRQIRFRICSA